MDVGHGVPRVDVTSSKGSDGSDHFNEGRHVSSSVAVDCDLGIAQTAPQSIKLQAPVVNRLCVDRIDHMEVDKFPSPVVHLRQPTRCTEVRLVEAPTLLLRLADLVGNRACGECV